MARHERGDYVFRVEGGQKTQRFAMVSLGLRDFLVRILLALSRHVWRDSGLRRFPFECIFLAAAWFVVPASHHRAFGAVRGQRSRKSTCAPLDALTCGSQLFRHSSTGAMARSAP